MTDPDRMPTIDVLMVTYDCPESTALCLPRLLDTCGENARVWLWLAAGRTWSLRVK